MHVTNQPQCSNGTKKELESGTNSEILTNYRKPENTTKGSISAEEFVKNILDEGSRVPCDETCSEFTKNELPDYYDPVKFRRAQKFFKHHIFALYFNKLLGLIITLASPSVLAILQMTKMSGCIMTSYRRYTATLLHMNIWYKNDITEDSRAMQSIRAVKNMHNSACKQALSKGMPPITQKDMVWTQFGFMGFAISRSEMIGIHNASQEDLECFIHFWRVIGYLMGIQDRFNLCRTSLKETKEVCEVFINKVLQPSYEDKNEEFLKMTSYLIAGMWNINPSLNYNVILLYLHDILKPKNWNPNMEETTEIHKKTYCVLNFYEKLYFNVILFVLSMMKFTIVRVYLNWHKLFGLWMIERFPFLAIYSFGYRNSIVSVKLSNSKTKTN